MGSQRYLVVTASMGAGHDRTAAELARRFQAIGDEARVVDLLQILPAGIGTALRRGYAGMLRHAPSLYDAIYRAFFVPRDRLQPTTSPLAVLGARALAPIIADYAPTAVVSTFHVAGQVCGRLRRTGRLGAPSVVVVTEFVPHALWLDPGTDLFCCLHPGIAAEATRRTGRPAIAPGPVVDPEFLEPGDPAAVRRELGLAGTDRAVLIGTGSWGVGDTVRTAEGLSRVDGIRPVVLCGNNAGLHRRLAGLPGVIALGWRSDVPALLAAADALIDNAGGSMCLEAFGARVPVVEYRPLPGHGGPVARALVTEGLVTGADTPADLLAALHTLRPGTPDRARQVEAAAAIFTEDPAAAIGGWLAAG